MRSAPPRRQAGRAHHLRKSKLYVLGTFVQPSGQQTAQPHIYSAGDVIGFPALASRSMEQARVAMVHAFDLKYKQQAVNLLPFGVYTIPECSMVKDTEDTSDVRAFPMSSDGLVAVTMPEAASSVTTLAS